MDVDVLDAAAFSKDYHTALPKGFRGRHRDPMASFNDERRKMRAGQLNESKQYGCIIDMLNQPMQQSLWRSSIPSRQPFNFNSLTLMRLT